MKYYLHDTNSFQDEKVTELYIEFGYEGLGLFYTILERLGYEEKPIKTIVLKKQLKVGKRLEKCWKFMESLGIISSNNGETFSKNLLKFSEKYQIKKEKNRKKISEWREKQALEKNVTGYEPVCNGDKLKESKVNKSKVNINNSIIKISKLFYDTEINNNSNVAYIDKYKNLVEFLFGDNELKQPIKNILKLEQQLTYEQFNKLHIKAKEKDTELKQLLNSWLNKPEYSKGKKSIYLTLNNWLNRK